jgi:hypothetical protein
MLKGGLSVWSVHFFYVHLQPLNLSDMVKTLLVSVLIIAVGMILLLVKVLLRRNGSFSSQHIHDSQAMKDRGIHCVIDQDREMRTKSKTAVNEK